MLPQKEHVNLLMNPSGFCFCLTLALIKPKAQANNQSISKRIAKWSSLNDSLTWYSLCFFLFVHFYIWLGIENKQMKWHLPSTIISLPTQLTPTYLPTQQFHNMENALRKLIKRPAQNKTKEKEKLSCFKCYQTYSLKKNNK